MIEVYKADSVFQVDHGWLRSRFYFSFADYYDPGNISFGPMRVLNDDVIQPGRGFGMHPHREMEIVTIVLRGHLAHEDSMGNKASTTYGQIQRMSAGTGVLHSEVNPSSREDVSLLQMWFIPVEPRLEPSYEQTEFDTEAMKNRLLPVVSQQSGDNIAHIHQDLTIYLSDLEAGKKLTFTQPEGRRMFLLILDGEAELGGRDKLLGRRDAARIENVSPLTLTANSDTRLMLIDLP